MSINRISPEFVEFIPDQIEEGKIYISKKYKTAIHLCCCGCGEEVVTPLSPVDWKLVESRNGISIHPSIGNWDYRCKSHYTIKDNNVEWNSSFTDKKIQLVKIKDRKDKENYIKGKQPQQIPKNNKFTLYDLWLLIKSIFK